MNVARNGIGFSRGVQFKCPHYGKPIRSGEGIRKACKSMKCYCKVSSWVKKGGDGRFTVITCVLNHTNHACSPEIYNSYTFIMRKHVNELKHVEKPSYTKKKQ